MKRTAFLNGLDNGWLIYIHVDLFRGADFRTSFRSIGGLRALTAVPFMALSASAPPAVAKSIEDSLHLKSPVHISHSLDRPNIFYPTLST